MTLTLGIRAIELFHEIRGFPYLPSLLGAPGSGLLQDISNYLKLS